MEHAPHEFSHRVKNKRQKIYEKYIQHINPHNKNGNRNGKEKVQANRRVNEQRKDGIR